LRRKTFTNFGISAAAQTRLRAEALRRAKARDRTDSELCAIPCLQRITSLALVLPCARETI